MKNSETINENDLAAVSGGVSSQGMETVSIVECCGEWKCNICGSSVKFNNSSVDGVPICNHYIYLSCRSCGYYNESNGVCRKKL